jgi:uncharacterized repeat protein (TIGR04138 family)
MLGQPEPIYPVRGPKTPSREPSPLQRTGFVSVWVGTFGSVEEAEAYFGIPDEIGVYLPPEAFAADQGVGDFPPENLEVHFEQVAPRPLRDLLADATFAVTFLDRAIEAGSRQGVAEAQGVALLYDFDYRRREATSDPAGPMRFLGAFPYVQVSPVANLQPFQDLARATGYSCGAVLFVALGLEVLGKRRQERGEEAVHVAAREFCEYLLGHHGADTAAVMRELRLRRSEDVGRIITGMVAAGLARRHESNAVADLVGVFDLGDAGG